jgi:hypothetical protein
LKKLFFFLKNFSRAEVWIKKPMNFPSSVPIVGRNCLVVYREKDSSGELVFGFWQWDDSDWATEAAKGIDYFYQL